MIAITRFETGPAAATQIMSRLGWRSAPKLTGTGLAQPNIIPDSSSMIAGTTMVPIGSMCLRGLRKTRPATKAVVSPNIRAT